MADSNKQAVWAEYQSAWRPMPAQERRAILEGSLTADAEYLDPDSAPEESRNWLPTSPNSSSRRPVPRSLTTDSSNITLKR